MTSEALLVDITDNVNNVNNGAKHIKNRGRNSFYSLPKTLSEDDDPFGLFQGSKERKQQSVTDDLIITKCSTVAEEPCTGLLVQIETESPKISESFQSVSSRTSGTGAGMLGVSGISGTSGLSIHGASFGNMSRISSQPGSVSNLSDDVFIQESQLVSSNEEEPNWDKLLNEAQFVALKISDPKASAKTPLAHSRLTSAKLNNFSPGDNIDSPGLLDTSKDNPDNFLVKLTPESSPKRAAKKEHLLSSTSPTLNKKFAESMKISKKEVDEVVKATVPKNEVVDVESKEPNDKKSNPPIKKFTTPVRKGPSKENIKPRQLSQTDVKKVPNNKLNLSTKPKVTTTASEVKRPNVASRQPQSEKKMTSLIAGTPVTKSEAINKKPTSSAAKTLQFTPKPAAKTPQFTPKSSVTRPGRRESLSAVKDKPTKTTDDNQFKLPSRTTDAHIKKTVMPPRSGRLQPTRLSLQPAKGPVTAVRPSTIRPTSSIRAAASSGPLRPPRPLDTSLSSLPKPSGVNKSGLQRPTLLRQGSALCQSTFGSKLSTPVMSRQRRPSDIGLKSGAASAGMCLPSPQILNKNSSLICSTPTITATSKQKTASVLPSPISNVKRKV